MLIDEEVLPEELDEGLAEKLHSQSGVVLLEDEAQRMLLLGGVLRPLDDAREENDKHLLDAFLVKEIAGTYNSDPAGGEKRWQTTAVLACAPRGGRGLPCRSV